MPGDVIKNFVGLRVNINGTNFPIPNNNLVSLKVTRVIGDSVNSFTLEVYDDTADNMETLLASSGKQFSSIEFWYRGKAGETEEHFQGTIYNWVPTFIGASMMLSITGITGFNSVGLLAKETISWVKPAKPIQAYFYTDSQLYASDQNPGDGKELCDAYVFAAIATQDIGGYHDAIPLEEYNDGHIFDNIKSCDMKDTTKWTSKQNIEFHIMDGTKLYASKTVAMFPLCIVQDEIMEGYSNSTDISYRPNSTTGTGSAYNTVNIPPKLGDIHTYMGWQMITAKGSKQYKLREEAGMNFDSEGFGKINGRYVIACTTTYGSVGDYVDFYQEDGLVLQTVIGDIKSQSDEGCNTWGHNNGRCIVEFVVNKDTWYPSHTNPGNPGCHPEWNKYISKAVITGGFWGSASGTNVTGELIQKQINFTESMQRVKPSEVFKRVINALPSEIGITVGVVDDTLPVYYESWTQNYQTVFEYIEKVLCARAIATDGSAGFYFAVTDGKANFRKRNYMSNSAASVTVQYGKKDSNVISFSTAVKGSVIMAGGNYDDEGNMTLDTEVFDDLTGDIQKVNLQGIQATQSQGANSTAQDEKIGYDGYKPKLAVSSDSLLYNTRSASATAKMNAISKLTAKAELKIWGTTEKAYAPGNYIQVNVMKKTGYHYSTGKYWILKCEDSVSSGGFIKTLSLIKMGGDILSSTLGDLSEYEYSDDDQYYENLKNSGNSVAESTEKMQNTQDTYEYYYNLAVLGGSKNPEADARLATQLTVTQGPHTQVMSDSIKKGLQKLQGSQIQMAQPSNANMKTYTPGSVIK